MMGQKDQQKELFSYNVDLDKRVRTDNPLGRVAGLVDFTFARQEVAHGRHTGSRPSYKQHRVVDNAHGIITAQLTTGGAVKEDTQLFGLVEQHQWNTSMAVQTIVADSQYGTVENFLGCVDRGIAPHMADLKRAQQEGGSRLKFFGDDQFIYDTTTDTYRCPAGQRMRPWQKRSEKKAYQYMTKAGTCDTCHLRAQCTEAKGGRRIQRFDRQVDVNRARAQAQSRAARRDRKRRRHLMEGSFADATNCHGFKRSRWRRLWRQQIQNHLIAACQNIRILMRRAARFPGNLAAACRSIFQSSMSLRLLCHHPAQPETSK